MYDRILVPVDGSDHGRLAAEHALSLAEAFGASVRLLNVVDVEAAAGPFDAGGVTEEFVEEQLEGGRQTVAETAASLSDSSGVETAAVRGSPAETIVEEAEDYGADLIVMGTHGRSGVSRYLSGSVAEEVVRHADRPVMTLEATEAVGEHPTYDDVLVATDGSEQSLAAVERAADVAGAFGGRLHVLTVVNVTALEAETDVEVDDDAVDSLERRGQRSIDQAVERIDGSAVEVVTAVEQGDPADSIRSYAADRGVDLIVIGKSGRSGVARVLLGGTAERIIRHAEVPVLAADAE